MDPAWKKKYSKEGINAFAKDSLKQLDVMRTSLYTSYMLFLRGLARQFPDGSPMGIEIQRMTTLTSGVIHYIDILRGQKGRSATDQEIEILFDKIRKWNDKFELLAEEAQRSAELKKALDIVYAETDINLEKLLDLNKVIGTTMGGLATGGEGSKIDAWKRTSPGSFGGMKELGTQLGMGIFGPWGYLAGKGLGVGMDFLKARRARIAEKQGGKFAEQFSPIGIPPELKDSFFNRKSGPAGFSPNSASGLGAGSFMGGTSSSDEKQATFGFMTFFDKYAYKAKWTKEVLDALKGKTGGGPSAGLGDLVSGLKGMLPLLSMVGSGLAILASALGGWALGRALDSKIKSGVDKLAGKGAYDDFWLGLASGGKQGGNVGRVIGSALPGAGLWGTGTETQLTPRTQRGLEKIGHPTDFISTNNRIANSLETMGSNIVNSIKQIATRQDTPATPLYPQSTRNSGDSLMDRFNQSDEENH